MLAEQRRSLILEILAEKGSVSVTDLHRRLGVSRETIRRDITRLDQENRLRKTHGGALSFDGVEPSFDERMAVNLEGKRRIGREAAELVPDGASMLIDYGTTTLCLADALTERRRLTVYTNDLHIAARLAGRNDNRVLLLGGELSATESATLGWDTVAMLARYYTDFAFVGAGALSAHPWLTDFSREAAELRTCMLNQARTPVLLADHTKFQRVAPVRVVNLEKVKLLVTDQAPPDAMATGLRALGLDIAVA
ncbi:MAG: DeoR/GlpR transcriptional regulator [Hyphomicrobiales bacterium]|nr:DeoR/GlpR transcriptional regulator [Hyphomicrobiales bacterium]MCP5373832.1 DeoR/GlpR transcriptional regulator [Hyphomicrobiales bacterium]